MSYNQQTNNVIFRSNTAEKNIFTNRPFPDVFENKRPMQIVNPLYDQHIIKPPKANVTHGRIPDIEILCSEDRNYKLYPEPNNYVVKLKDTYRDVTSVTLFNASIPNTSYIINKTNNLIYFRESACDKLVAEIPEGDYDADKLVEKIKEAMKVPCGTGYLVSIDECTNKICIELDGEPAGGQIFCLDFLGGKDCEDSPIYPNRSSGRVLGFKKEMYLYANGKATINTNGNVIGNSETTFLSDFEVGDYFSDGEQVFKVISLTSDDMMMVTSISMPTGTIENVCLAKFKHKGPNKINLNPDPFIVLDILELENLRSNSTSVDRAFAVIPMVFPHNTNNFLIEPATERSVYTKYFNPPLAKLDRLTIKFKDKQGNLIDFNGIEHYMEFRIKTMNAPGAYDPGSLSI